MTTPPEIVLEMNRLIDAARVQKIDMRVIGGLAVRVHSPVQRQAFTREYPDIDFVVHKKARRKLSPFFKGMGYIPDKQFNILNGTRRQIFIDTRSGRRIDVFVGDFEMCHKLPMKNRLKADPVTVPLAELLLSKTQIFELNRKDALDIISLLLNNELGRDDDGKINLHRIARLCLRYWGLYKTTSINLARVEDMLLNEDLGLSRAELQTVLRRIKRIQRTFRAINKNLFWKLRNELGTRIRWYAEVEEVDQ
jgi:uncharacterized protein YjiS (DUF1127 family)